MGPSIKYTHKIFRKTNISNPLIRTRTTMGDAYHNFSILAWLTISQIFIKISQSSKQVSSRADGFRDFRSNFFFFFFFFLTRLASLGKICVVPKSSVNPNLW